MDIDKNVGRLHEADPRRVLIAHAQIKAGVVQRRIGNGQNQALRYALPATDGGGRQQYLLRPDPVALINGRENH